MRFSSAIALFFVVMLAGCSRRSEATPPALHVATTTVTLQNVTDALPASGIIEAVDKTQLGFMVEGRIATIEVADGAIVTAGQVLARLDDADFRHQLAIAEARLEETRARHLRLSRMRELGSLTATDFDQISSALRQAESVAELARQRVAYAVLRAPFAGLVTRHSAAAGTVVAPGVPVCSVLAPAPVWATLSVPEVDAPKISPGQTALVALAATGSVEVAGPVEAILPQADALTRSFSVKVRLANADQRFRPGNVVTARIATGGAHPVLTVPPTAVQHYPDGALYVWIVDPVQSTVTRRIISVGRTRGTAVEIVAGLKAGEIIVTGADAPLFDGMKISRPMP